MDSIFHYLELPAFPLAPCYVTLRYMCTKFYSITTLLVHHFRMFESVSALG